jgi:hypothetical protein
VPVAEVMMVFSLAYRSRNLIEQTHADSLAELTKLLEVSRERNAKLGVTGALIFNQGLFAQILEGDEAAVLDIFESIKRDPRHTDIVLWPFQSYEERRFKSWSMAFVGPSPGAQKYYERFSLTNGFEWTQASAGALVDLVFDLVAMQDGSGKRQLH